MYVLPAASRAIRLTSAFASLPAMPLKRSDIHSLVTVSLCRSSLVSAVPFAALSCTSVMALAMFSLFLIWRVRSFPSAKVLRHSSTVLIASRCAARTSSATSSMYALWAVSLIPAASAWACSWRCDSSPSKVAMPSSAVCRLLRAHCRLQTWG
jgi:hypothetical protein